MSWEEDLAFVDATGQADMVRRREVKPEELVAAAIKRIERINPQLNAVVTPIFDQGLQAAKTVPIQGPFPGVPFLLKDLGATCAGVRHTAGCAFTKDFVPDHDSELAIRQRRAGLILLGKTNCPELGILPTTEPKLFGPARNPWNPGYSTGGSSGGSAAAVAAGLVPVAHANDGGGSIRVPSSCCGLFGLKPTRARNPHGPDMGDVMSGCAIEHAVTRSVRDSAALLDATAGPDLGDPYWAPPQARPYIQEVGAPPGQLRIAFTTQAATGAPVHEDCVKAVLDAAKLCESLGHRVTEATPTLDGNMITQAFMVLYTVGGAGMFIDGMSMVTGRAPSPDQFEPLTWAVYEMGKQQSGVVYLLSVTALQGISRQVARFMVDYDVWLTPTLAEPPASLGTFDSPPDQPLAGLFRAAQYVPFTPICNFTGQPAMSVPLHWNEAGLPIGTHFIARFGDEATLFRLAAQLEEARPWASRRPLIHA